MVFLLVLMFPGGGGSKELLIAACMLGSELWAIPAPTVSSDVAFVCWIAKGKVAAIMMMPMPSRITANITPVKVMPRGRGRKSVPFRAIVCHSLESSLGPDDGAVVSVDQIRRRAGAALGNRAVAGVLRAVEP